MKAKTPDEIAKGYIERYTRRYFKDFDKKHSDEIDSLILWELHEQFGFGKKRLEKFYKAFAKAYEELQRRYEIARDEDAIWICKRKLEDLGVDLNKWKNEIDI